MNKVNKEIVACCSLVWISSSLYTFHKAAELSVFDMVSAGYLLGYFQQRIQNRRRITIKGRSSATLGPKGKIMFTAKTTWPTLLSYPITIIKYPPILYSVDLDLEGEIYPGQSTAAHELSWSKMRGNRRKSPVRQHRRCPSLKRIIGDITGLLCVEYDNATEAQSLVSS